MVDAVGDWSVIALSRPHGWRSKKALLIMSAILFVVAVGSYTLWSRHTWAQYTPRHTQWHQAIKSDVGKVIELPVASEKDQDALLVRLESLSRRISSEQASMCEVPAVVSWQQRFIAGYRDMQTACGKMVAGVALFQKQLTTVTTYIADDRKLAVISAKAVPPSEASDDVWGAQVELWGRVADEVKHLSVSAAFKPTQQVAVERMTAVKAAWQELIAAHQLKDKVKYVAAQSALGASYDGLDTITLDDTKHLSALTDELSAAYLKAFN